MFVDEDIVISGTTGPGTCWFANATTLKRAMDERMLNCIVSMLNECGGYEKCCVGITLGNVRFGNLVDCEEGKKNESQIYRAIYIVPYYLIV